MQRAWACPTCGHEFNRLAIEEMLMGQTQRMLVKWQTQDLKCTKCRNLRVNDFMDHCGCGGEWTGTMDRNATMKDLQVLERVAVGHGLRMLGNLVGEILEGI